MALGVDEIYRLLPKVDCGQCPSRSCRAFARLLAEDCGALKDCGRLSSYSAALIEAQLCRGQ